MACSRRGRRCSLQEEATTAPKCNEHRAGGYEFFFISKRTKHSSYRYGWSTIPLALYSKILWSHEPCFHVAPQNDIKIFKQSIACYRILPCSVILYNQKMVLYLREGIHYINIGIPEKWKNIIDYCALRLERKQGTISPIYEAPVEP